MTCRNASFAAQTPQSNTAAPACSQPFPPTSEDDLALALITKVMHALNSLPPLVLTQAMQRDAMILDRNKAAKMLDMQAVHRLESDLRKLTNRILAKGVCSDAKHG